MPFADIPDEPLKDKMELADSWEPLESRFTHSFVSPPVPITDLLIKYLLQEWMGEM